MISWNEIKEKHQAYIHNLDDEQPIGKGWNNLIDEMCTKITNHHKYCGCKGIVVKQVKEKFGGLRFYWDLLEPEKCGGAWEETSNIVRDAEDKSYSTCDVCGESGEPRRGAWVVTRCNEHWGPLQEKYGH